jgi:hypothetical protein
MGKKYERRGEEHSEKERGNGMVVARITLTAF